MSRWPAQEPPVTPDAFMHLPGLRDRVTPPEKSAVRATPEVLANGDEHARRLGRPQNWRLSDQEIEHSRRAILGHLKPAQDL
jgi:glutathione-specific gamma-glutamylcyclotransferase